MSDTLGVIGDLVEDIVVWQAGPLAPGTDTPSRIHRARGGSAANVAALAADLVPTRFIGRVGDDTAGAALEGSLRASGVAPMLQHGGRTGAIVILVAPDGERSMLPDRGASAEIGPVEADWLAGLGALHATAYSLTTEPSSTSVREALRVVRDRGGLTSLDVSSVAVIEQLGCEAMADLIAEIDPAIVFANTSESAALGWDVTPPSDRVVIVKRGARPTEIHTPSGTATVEVERVERIRDLTAAGDAFAAGCLASCLLSGLNRDALLGLRGADDRLHHAVLAAHENAARVLQLPGSGNLLP